MNFFKKNILYPLFFATKLVTIMIFSYLQRFYVATILRQSCDKAATKQNWWIEILGVFKWLKIANTQENQYGLY